MPPLPARLEELGWTADRDDELGGLGPSELVARVAAQRGPLYELWGDSGELLASPTGRLRSEAAGAADLPAVGDWVVATRASDRSNAAVRRVLPRRTELARLAAGRHDERQVLAANVDAALVVASLNLDLNLRRLERYLAMAADGGVHAVVLLSKADLVKDAAADAAEVAAALVGAEVHALSALTGAGLDALAPHLARGRTVVLLGSSGVGKSTLLNRLLGADAQATAGVRAEDDRGRHTTSAREMFALPGGALVIDTPGLRELALADDTEGLDAAFPDIAALAEGCRFRDCGHATEPGCAVTAAAADGRLPAERLAAWRKLVAEKALIARRVDGRLRAEANRRLRAMHRAYRNRPPRGGR